VVERARGREKYDYIYIDREGERLDTRKVLALSVWLL
jgi:hypothetical protein